MSRARLAWGLVAVIAILHYDFWFWDDRTLVFGFVPIGLFFQARDGSAHLNLAEHLGKLSMLSRGQIETVKKQYVEMHQRLLNFLLSDGGERLADIEPLDLGAKRSCNRCSSKRFKFGILTDR